MADPDSYEKPPVILGLPPSFRKRKITWNPAIVISVAAALFTGWQGWEAHEARADSKQAAQQARRDAKDAADQARRDAKDAADKQLEDVRTAKQAAQDSAKAAQDLAKGMERSAKAAEASANAGQESVSISKRTLLLSERPVLETLNPRLVHPLAAGEKIQIQVDTYNTGKGPAYDVKVENWFRALRKFEFAFTGQITSRTDVLGAGNSFGKGVLTTTTDTPPLTKEALDQIQAKSLMVYVYGLVEFEERILDRPEKQSYTYCYYYDPGGAPNMLICPQKPLVPSAGQFIPKR